MSTTVVNIYREPCDVYIGRAGHGRNGYFGNPFKLPFGLDSPETRAGVVEQFREYFLGRIEKDPEYRQAVEGLRGRRLGCFCKPKPCHGDVIAAWLDRGPLWCGAPTS